MGSAKELIPILAERFGIAFETALVLDRSLADHGLRTKGRGRTPPEMTREDCINFLIAVMTYTVAKRAHEDVEIWRNAKAKIYLPDYHVDDLDNADFDYDVFDDDDPLQNLIVKRNRREAGRFKYDYPYFQQVENKSMTLSEFLLFITHHQDRFYGSYAKLTIDPQDGCATFTFTKIFGEKQHQFFFYPEPRLEPIDDMRSVHRAGWVWADTLDEICSRTKDPLAGGGS
jgi:hypothetical protein